MRERSARDTNLGFQSPLNPELEPKGLSPKDDPSRRGPVRYVAVGIDEGGLGPRSTPFDFPRLFAPGVNDVQCRQLPRIGGARRIDPTVPGHRVPTEEWAPRTMVPTGGCSFPPTVQPESYTSTGRDPFGVPE